MGIDYEEGVMVDASVFIKHWRSKIRSETMLAQLTLQWQRLCVSAVAKYEVFVGVQDHDMDEWHHIFDGVTVLAFDGATIEVARDIFLQLKRENKMIDGRDIMIAATAMVNDMSLATLNRGHYERIKGLRLV
jgi:predicted nucleic acid-binding protein